MRHKTPTKVKIKHLKYAVLNKNTNNVTIYHFKKSVADTIGVSVRTLDRNMPYKNDAFEVYLIANVVS